jgi:hypothetical protein
MGIEMNERPAGAKVPNGNVASVPNGNTAAGAQNARWQIGVVEMTENPQNDQR